MDMNMKKVYVALVVSSTLVQASCNDPSWSKYTEVVKATTALLKQVGTDLVRIDCQYAGVISIVAKNQEASARVQKILAKNAQLALDACPYIFAPRIQITTGAVS
jgi:hypothetical protein